MYLIERDKAMHEIDQLSHAWEYGRAVDDCYEIVKSAQKVEAIPIEFIERYVYKHGLYTCAMEVISAWRAEREEK